MKRMVIYILLCGLLLSACGIKRSNINSQFALDDISNCYETNRNIFGEHTGRICKCGSLIAYSKYTYKHQYYSQSRTDGLYIYNERTDKNYKIADGVICSIVIREDGIYYLKLNQKGEVYLYNFDLYRYGFQTEKNELLIKDCTFVQFSEDSAFYCQHYLGDRVFYSEKGMPLDLPYEGKIVKHSLVTGEEKVVAEIEGNIFNFLVTENSIYFAGGEGNAFDGGRNIFMCDHNGGQMHKLTDNDCGYVKILYANDAANTLFFSTMYFVSDETDKEPEYCLLNYHTLDLIWTYPQNALVKLGACGEPIFYKGNLYFCKADNRGASNELLCLSTTDKPSVTTIQVQDICNSIYVFNDKMYISNNSNLLLVATP